MFKCFGCALVISTAVATAARGDPPADQPPATAADAAPVVRIDAQWLRLTPAQMAAGPVAPPPPATAANIYCQARTVGFSGELVTLSSQRTTLVVKGATPVVAPGVSTYSVETEPEQVGVTLTVTPRVVPGGQVVVDVGSKVSADLAHSTPQPTTQPSGADAFAEGVRVATGRPDRSEQEFHTTVRLRPDVPMVVGGMTEQPGTDRGGPLCLVLTAHVDDDRLGPTTRP